MLAAIYPADLPSILRSPQPAPANAPAAAASESAEDKKKKEADAKAAAAKAEEEAEIAALKAKGADRQRSGSVSLGRTFMLKDYLNNGDYLRDWGNIEMGDQLDDTGDASVNKCGVKDEKRSYAIKKLKPGFLSKGHTEENGNALWDEELERNIIAYCHFYTHFDHPNVMGLAWVVTDPHHFAVGSNFCDNGSLRDFIQKSPIKLCNWATRVSIAKGIADGLNFLHSQESVFVMCHLRGEKVLLNNKLVPKITALSLSRATTWADTAEEKKKKGSDAEKTLTRTKTKSDLEYQEDVELQTTLAPEMYKITMAEATPPTDWFSYAMVCYELFLGHHPFQLPSDDPPASVKSVIEAGSRPKIPDDCPLPLKQLLEGCWKQEPSYRFGYDQVCEKLELIKAITEPAPFPWGADEPEGGWAAACAAEGGGDGGVGGGGDTAPAEAAPDAEEAAAPAEEEAAPAEEEAAAPAEEEAAAPAEEEAAAEDPPAEEVSAAEPVAEE